MNLPNTLSIFRMCLVPVFVLVFFSGREHAMAQAAAIYFLAGATDVLDGFIARHFNMITKLGKILDPLADKLMTITVFICITIRGIIPWWLIVLLFAKDFVMILGGIKLYREVSGVFAANVFGKATTVFLVLGGIVMMLFNDSLSPTFKLVFELGAIIMSALAFVSYLRQYVNYKKHNDTSKL